MRADDLLPGDEPVTRGAPLLPGHDPTSFVGPVDDPDRYELLGEGIAGGEGVTWRARYVGRLSAPLPLAVKMLRPPARSAEDWPTALDRQRWQDQTALLRHVHLDHVVRLYEIFSGAAPHPGGAGAGQPARSAFLAMEWVDGPTLHEKLAGTPATAATIRQRLGYVVDAGSALANLMSHSRSGGNPSLHRDVKPTNCIVHPDRGLVLIDVSTLRLLDDGFDPAGMHTPEYTAPEVLDAPHLPRTAASDIYALGALAVFCLTGQDPPPAGPPARVRPEVEAVAAACAVGEPADLATHILGALDPDPGNRPRDAERWSSRLVELASPATRTRAASQVGRRIGVAAALAGILLAVGALAWHPWQHDLPRAGAASAATPTPSSDPRESGTITSPADRSEVKQCAYFAGTARLPAGRTLILAMQNLSNGDPARYTEFVYGWRDPSTLATWQGVQFFGQLDDAIGQVYRVQLEAVSLDVARNNVKPDDYGDAMAKTGTVLASIEVQRVEGAGPHNCDGPP